MKRIMGLLWCMGCASMAVGAADNKPVVDFFRWLAGPWEAQGRQRISEIDTDGYRVSRPHLWAEHPDGIMTHKERYAYTLAPSGNRLMRETVYWNAHGFAFNLQIFSARDGAGEFDVYDLMQYVARDDVKSGSKFVHYLGEAAPNGNAMFRNETPYPSRVWLREGPDFFRMVLTKEKPEEVLAGKRPGVEIGAGSTQVRLKPENLKLSEKDAAAANASREVALLAQWAGTWAEAAVPGGQDGAASDAFSLAPSISGLYLLGEYPREAPRFDIFIANVPRRLIVWMQITEKKDAPEGLEISDALGTLRDDGKAVLWNKNGRPVELWSLPGADTIVRMTPDAEAPFDVARAKHITTYTRAP